MEGRENGRADDGVKDDVARHLQDGVVAGVGRPMRGDVIEAAAGGECHPRLKLSAVTHTQPLGQAGNTQLPSAGETHS